MLRRGASCKMPSDEGGNHLLPVASQIHLQVGRYVRQDVLQCGGRPLPQKRVSLRCLEVGQLRDPLRCSQIAHWGFRCAAQVQPVHGPDPKAEKPLPGGWAAWPWFSMLSASWEACISWAQG